MTDETQESTDRLAAMFSKCTGPDAFGRHLWDLETRKCRHCNAQFPYTENTKPDSDALGKLRRAIIDNTRGDLFWIGEILLSELEKETGFKG